MKKTSPDNSTDVEAELALLRRRLARSEVARSQAEALLEDKSRVLAEANEDLRIHKEMLSSELTQRTRQLLDAQRVAGFGTMIWDIDSGRGELSPHCQDILGLTGSLEIRTIQTILSRIIREDRRDAIRWARSIIDRVPTSSRNTDNDETRELGLNLRIAGVGADIPNRMIRVMALLEHDTHLNHALVFLTLQDITKDIEAANEAELLRRRDQRRLAELERLADELRLAHQQAEAANAAKTRFLAMMSHDIRTPMNGVIGMLELFEDGNLSDSQRETLAHVKASGEQLRVLLDDIIDLEQAESGKLVLNEAPLDIYALLISAIGFWTSAATDKGLALEFAQTPLGQPMPDYILADRQRLRQVIDNLLSNAIKYTREGHITMRAGLVGKGRLRIEVIDTGIGVPVERRRELFEDFGQISLYGNTPGSSGLGLAICHRIVELMGGKIGVTDGPGGKGSCFWVEAPFAPAERIVSRNAAPAKQLKMPDGRQPRILVAEDVETNRLVVQGLLHKLGCDVELTVNGEQAIDTVQQSDFDLVLMDVSMPGIDGIEATRQIRSLPAPVGRIPILALTAYSRPEELAPIFEAGAWGSIQKPIVRDDLYKAISAVFRKNQIESETKID